MSLSDKIGTMLSEKSQKNVDEKLTGIEFFMNWLFSNYDFRINQLSFRPEYKEKSEMEFKELDDTSYNTITLLAEIKGFSKTMVEKINRIILSSYVPIVNEIRDYFEKIAPLGYNIDVTQEFNMPTVRKYFNCLMISNNYDNELIYNIFERWIIASVNSALGIKHNDVMLILSGPQGLYKTSYLNNLCPDTLGKQKYLFTGHIEPTLTNQNTANYLCEKFIINIDDQLEVIFGKEYNSMKAIISIDRVTSRRVYAKFDKTRKRIANFVGSVNSTEFLSDNQNRRYFVIEISGINSDYKNIDMDRLWAEAFIASKKINPYAIFNKNIYTQINQISNQFTQSSIEQVLISRLFSPVQNDVYSDEIFMTSGEIILELQKMTSKSISQNRLVNELKRLGFKRISRYFPELKNSKYGYKLYTTTDKSMTYFKEYVENTNSCVF